jgi:hypothetical protein
VKQAQAGKREEATIILSRLTRTGNRTVYKCADLFSNPAQPLVEIIDFYTRIFSVVLLTKINVVKLVSNFFTINLDEAVAYGAAVLAAIILLFSSSTLPVFPSVSRLLDLS